ncbi:MAG TPA: hypothetical protein VNB22_23490 [Pyrinomonadaceae bacterium]|nr:hypothetical protein [Pyrinomonadaceae bacterium]
MSEDNQQPDPQDFLKDLPVQAEEIGYKSEEMVLCGNCARANPPNRLKCMYCGAELELSAAQSAVLAPVLRKLENWESGFNLIYLPKGENVPAETAAQVAKFIGLEKDVVQKIFVAQKQLPVVRTETVKEAEILQNRLWEAGLETSIISDAQLAADNLPKRLRGLALRDGKILLILFNNDEIAEISPEDLVLIVSGAIIQKAVESTEARKKGETKILDATEIASDELLIDIYSKTDSTGYRILMKGFDFSCLGAEKGILARDNIKKLVVKLQSLAPNAKLVDDYFALRSALGNVWEIELRKDSQGLTRQRFGKFDLSNVSSSNNLQQFTKYSRLQWHLQK